MAEPTPCTLIAMRKRTDQGEQTQKHDRGAVCILGAVDTPTLYTPAGRAASTAHGRSPTCLWRDGVCVWVTVVRRCSGSCTDAVGLQLGASLSQSTMGTGCAGDHPPHSLGTELQRPHSARGAFAHS